MIWIVGLCAVVLFIIFAKRIVVFSISWILARILKCSSVRYGRVGIFSVTDIKLRYHYFTVEVDKVWLSSCFFNQDFTKPLVLCFGDIRLEVSKICSTSSRDVSSKSLFNNSNEKPKLPFKQRLKRYSSILQYVSANVNNLDVILLDVVLQDCLVHLAVEEIHFDTYRDRESVQCDLMWKILTCKMLQRSKTPDDTSSSDLLQISAGADIAVHFDPSTYFIKYFCVKTTDPVFGLSDGFFKIVQGIRNAKLFKRTNSDPQQNSNDMTSPSSTFSMKDFFPTKLNVDFKNATFRFCNSAAKFSKQASFNVKHIAFDLLRGENLIGNFNLLEMNCTDGETVSFSMVSYQASINRNIKEMFLECYVTSVNVSTNFDGICAWNETLSNIWSNFMSSSTNNAAPTVTSSNEDDDFDAICDDGDAIEQRVIRVEFELSSLNCIVGMPDDKQFALNLEFVSFNSGSVNSYEIGFEALSICFIPFGQKIYTYDEDGLNVHHWGHVLQLGAFLAKFEKGQPDAKRLLIQVERVHLEWNLEFVKHIVSVVKHLQCYSLAYKNSKVEPRSTFGINVQSTVTGLALFAPVRKTVSAVLTVGECRTTVMSENLNVTFGKAKLFRRNFNDKHVFSLDFADKTNIDCSTVEKLRFTLKRATKELVISSENDIVLNWSPLLHMILLETFNESKVTFSVFQKVNNNVEIARESQSKPIQIKIYSDKQFTLRFNLPNFHTIEFIGKCIKLYKTKDKQSAETKHLAVNFDNHQIFSFESLAIKRLPNLPKMEEFRRAFDDLSTPSNPLWQTKICKLVTVFPYEYNFADAYEELLNSVKWIKLIHGRRKELFTVQSPLPCDIIIQIQNAYFEMCDDPFEVKLRDNYELLIDEYFECERRQQIMDQKIDELRKAQPLLQRSKVDELYASLLKRNSDIYVQRSKQMYGGSTSRTSLFNWRLTDLEIKALADITLHGEANVLNNMRTMNPESVWPANTMEFNTLWCRHVGLDFKEWLMEMRDYPQPYVSMTDGHFWGRLAGAEVEGSDRAKRSAIVDVGAPFGEFVVYRNMPPLKFYYDFCSNIKSSKCTYGPCWEPCLATINQCFERINKPSCDPSPTLPFWDKMRLLLHGRLSMIIDQYVTAMLASSDPYNTTEQLEWTWRNFEFDWTNGVILVMSDLDTYVRTASKYDDCRLLHLPGLKLHIKMKWVCLGDPNDHHSVSPFAPDKLPDYSVHKEHDSYRAFRSQHLNLSLTLDIKNKDVVSDSKRPSVLLYANTFRWIDGLKNTISAVNRPVKRGPLFKSGRVKKAQLSRHYKDIQISVSLPKFIISYWASFSTDWGVRVIGHQMTLSSSHRLGLAPKRKNADCISRRQQSNIRMNYMNAELIDAEVYLYKYNPSSASKENDKDSEQSFFMSLNKLSYCREAIANNSSYNLANATPIHRLVAYDLKAAWTNSNRDVVLFILDGIQKARVLRRNLSTAALKTVPVADESSEKNSAKPRKSVPGGQSATETTFSPSGRLEGGRAASLLQQLIAEADTKFMAYSEETSEIPSQQLQGIVLSQMDDVLFTKWQIELINAQVLLKGCETGGYVLCTAAKAQVTQRFHVPVWRENQLLAKVFWVAMLSGMQDYATVGGKDNSKGFWFDKVKWLSKELIEDRINVSDQTLDVVDSLLSQQGQAAGGVVIENAPCDTSQQLQRIMSRCSCQIYFCQFTDSIDLDEFGDIRPLPVEEDDEFLQKKEYVDCFTLKYNMLNVCTNHLQYAMILDIVNNLILYVDPKKKETEEKLMRYRFQLQLRSVDDLRPNILHLQNDVRQLLLHQRYLERQMYLVSKTETPGDKESLDTHAQLEEEMEKCKQELSLKSDDLAMTISCFREKQVQRKRQAQFRGVTDGDQQAPIARRFEVCFEDAQWRLTGIDGQLGLADLHIRNFVYTKLSRINDSGEHLLELGFIKITNLLPNSPYRDILQSQLRNGIPNDRIPAARVICRELAPVGGISVKEHFEVNVVPMVVQMSYVFYRTMLHYFFPDRNIDTEDQQNLDTLDDQQQQTPTETENKSIKSSVNAVQAKSNAKINANRKKRVKSNEELKDDIDKMKKRAERNNMFLYIKIPEVPFMVSYKGEKEKNIEDVDNFQLEFPLVEYHDRNWTWLDLALAVKQRCKRVLLQQFMKQTLLKSRLGAAFGSGSSGQKPNPINLPEQEKARLLLGTKLMGYPEKVKQQSTPFFSPKNPKL